MDQTQPHAFWAELSACEHFVQIYDAEDMFVDTLAGFINGGLSAGHAAIVIATPVHRDGLDERLVKMGLDVDLARSQGQFISLDAEQTLGRFMVDGWPDKQLFTETVCGILERASANSRKVRAFGEMVALLWAQGNYDATIRLEHLWHELCHKESLALFCAYPKIGFTDAPANSIANVYLAHSKILAA